MPNVIQPSFLSNQERRSRPSEKAVIFCLSILALIFALLFADRYGVDWIYTDDIGLLPWFRRLTSGETPAISLLSAWDNDHPIGAQIWLEWAIQIVTGLNFKFIVYVSFFFIWLFAICSYLIIASEKIDFRFRIAVLCSIALLAFHPTQMELLLSPFQVGWFMVNLSLGVALGCVEFGGTIGVIAAALMCLIASFSSAQGAFVWIATAAYIALARKNSRSLVWASLFLVSGLLFIIRVLIHTGSRPSSHALSIVDLPFYFFQIIGGSFGLYRHVALLFVGVATLAIISFCAVMAVREGSPRATRAGLALCLFSLLCVASFSVGRSYLGIDWAIFSFHAAPLLVPMYLGAVALAVSLVSVERPNVLANCGSVLIFSLLALGFAFATPYGSARAKLWAMDRGYGMWTTCHTDAPFIVKAKASGVGDVAQFQAELPELTKMCSDSTSSLQGELTKEPALFDQLATTDAVRGLALERLWQDYATDVGLQLFFDPDDPGTARKLIDFAKMTAKAGSTYDPQGLKQYEKTFVEMP